MPKKPAYEGTFEEQDAEKIANKINKGLRGTGIDVEVVTHTYGRFHEGPIEASLCVFLPTVRFDESETALKGTRTYFSDVLGVLAAKGIVKSPSTRTSINHPLSGIGLFDEDPPAQQALEFKLRQPLDEKKLQAALSEARDMATQRIASRGKAVKILSKYLDHEIKAAKNPNYDSEPMPHLLELELPGKMHYGGIAPDEKGNEIYKKLKKLEEKGAISVEQWAYFTYVHVRDIEKLQKLCAEVTDHAQGAAASKQRKSDGRH
jgi:hypothetical protein